MIEYYAYIIAFFATLLMVFLRKALGFFRSGIVAFILVLIGSTILLLKSHGSHHGIESLMIGFGNLSLLIGVPSAVLFWSINAKANQSAILRYFGAVFLFFIVVPIWLAIYLILACSFGSECA